MKVNVAGAPRPAPFGLAASDTDADNVALLLPLEGTIAFETEAAAGRCERGSVLLLDMALPFRIEAASGELLRLSVPRSLARLTPAALSALHGMTVDGSTPAGRYLAKQIELLAEFEEEADRDHPEEFDDIVAVLLSAFIRLGVAPGYAGAAGEDPSIASVRAFIAANLSDLSLSPAGICSAFGISRSVLYRLMEPIGGVSSFIREQRLERARIMLTSAEPERGTVAKVACAVGFPSEPAFSRAFRAHYGATPSEVMSRARHVRAPSSSASIWMRPQLPHSCPVG